MLYKNGKMVIVVENGLDEPNSNAGRDCLNFT